MDPARSATFDEEYGRRRERYKVTLSAHTSAVAQRVQFSRGYIAFHVAMLIVNLIIVTWTLTSEKGRPSSVLYVFLEIVVLCSLVVEVGLRMCALRSSFWTRPWNWFDVGVAILCCASVALYFGNPGAAGEVEDAVVFLLSAIRYAAPSLRFVAWVRQRRGMDTATQDTVDFSLVSLRTADDDADDPAAATTPTSAAAASRKPRSPSVTDPGRGPGATSPPSPAVSPRSPTPGSVCAGPDAGSASGSPRGTAGAGKPRFGRAGAVLGRAAEGASSAREVLRSFGLLRSTAPPAHRRRYTEYGRLRAESDARSAPQGRSRRSSSDAAEHSGLLAGVHDGEQGDADLRASVAAASGSPTESGGGPGTGRGDPAASGGAGEDGDAGDTGAAREPGRVPSAAHDVRWASQEEDAQGIFEGDVTDARPSEGDDWVLTDTML